MQNLKMRLTAARWTRDKMIERAARRALIHAPFIRELLDKRRRGKLLTPAERRELNRRRSSIYMTNARIMRVRVEIGALMAQLARLESAAAAPLPESNPFSI